MTYKKIVPFVLLSLTFAACDDRPDKTRDRGFDSGPLTNLQAGIWIDPRGCQHWIIDDGFEGYLSARLDQNGKPVCSDLAPPSTIVGDHRSRHYEALKTLDEDNNQSAR